MGENEYPSTLSGPRRRSICCGAEVYHPFPFTSYRLSKAESLVCAACQQTVVDFEVVNALGEVLWPVPEWFDERAVPKSGLSDAGRLPQFALHLPLHARKRVLR